MKLLSILLLVAGLVACSPAVPAKSVSTALRAEANVRQYVYLLQNERGNGSGVLIRDGVLLTAAHVARIPGLFVMKDGKKLIAVPVRMDEKADLAIMLVEGLKCPCASIAKLNPKEDTPVRTVGYPNFTQIGVKVVTSGAIQGYHPADETNNTEYFVSTAAASPGNSGGGLFDKQGRLVGIVDRMYVLGSMFSYQVFNYITFGPSVKTIKAFLKG